MTYKSFTDFFNPNDFLEQFTDVMKTVKFTPRNPLNTEMFFLWCMIQSFEPKLFIESGTYRGYSANYICEGLDQTEEDVQFISYGYNLEGCIPFAIERLTHYNFATVIEGNSIKKIRVFNGEKRKTAFFIDGPKGKNLPDLLFLIIEYFRDIAFIAVHDCERDSSSNNRWYVEELSRLGFSLLFCGKEFQEEYSYLDVPLIDNEDMGHWRPYIRFGRPTSSYGTETGYLIPDARFHPDLRTRMEIYMQKIWFFTYPRLKNRLRKLTNPCERKFSNTKNPLA